MHVTCRLQETYTYTSLCRREVVLPPRLELQRCLRGICLMSTLSGEVSELDRYLSYHISHAAPGLQEMSQEIQSSAILAPYRPLELIASGGFVSVVSVTRPESIIIMLIQADAYGTEQRHRIWTISCTLKHSAATMIASRPNYLESLSSWRPD